MPTSRAAAIPSPSFDVRRDRIRPCGRWQGSSTATRVGSALFPHDARNARQVLARAEAAAMAAKRRAAIDAENRAA
jgi:hypothetical protein